MQGISLRVSLAASARALLCDTVLRGRRSSFLCHRNSPEAGLGMANFPSVALVSPSPSNFNSRAYSRGHIAHGFLAGSSGCLVPARKNVWMRETAEISWPQVYLALYAQSSGGCLCFTTTAWREHNAQSSHRNRKKKRGGRAPKASSLPAGDVAEGKSVLVVESPAKAKTIAKYVGEGHVVVPSFGHVRDLAAKAGSVRPDEDYKLVWEVPTSARPHLIAIKAALKGANKLVLASDPDREGEAIAWHVLEMLKMEGALSKGLDISRITFNEITKEAVLRSMRAPRAISANLVDAYLARRALDYLIGFDLSPVLWRKLPGSKSAGRVQSAALRLICEREVEIDAFVPREHWSVDAQVSLSDSMGSENGNAAKAGFPAKVTHVDGEKLSQFSLASDKLAEAVAKRVKMSTLSVSTVTNSRVRRNPLAPYITSTLQQDASSKLAFGASRTMALAQQLYEGVKLDNDELTGLITYMRTDGVQVSGEAVHRIRTLITKRYGEEYTPKQPRQFVSRAKNAQEAHEAIRPTDINRLPSMLVNVLDADALRLYSLIWSRTIACQMEQAIYAQVNIDIVNDREDLRLRASSSSVSFLGFLMALKDDVALGTYVDGGSEGGEDHQEGLSCLEAGDPLVLDKVQPNQHFTEAPPRYSEGTLVKRLEELGIGRPSTYASIFKTLQARHYIRIEKRRIFPESRGRLVSTFLLHYFPTFLDYNFTAKLETQLDDVSAGRTKWKEVLEGFWPDFHGRVTSILNTPFEEVVKLLEDAFADQFFSRSTERACPSCREGTMGLKLSRFGSGYFLGCSRYPQCMYKTNCLSPDSPDSSDDEDISAHETMPTVILGVDPQSGLEIFLRDGRYGKYLELGRPNPNQKPKRTAIPKDMYAGEIALETAVDLLKYPYELGKHPETNAAILVSMGKFGPFVRHKGVLVSTPKDSLASLTVDQAVKLLESKSASRRGRRPRVQDGPSSQDKAKAGKKSTNKAKAAIAASTKKVEVSSRREKLAESKPPGKQKNSEILAVGGKENKPPPRKGLRKKKGKKDGAEDVETLQNTPDTPLLEVNAR